MMIFQNISNISPLLLEGKKVLVRVDINVPLKENVVIDDYRIQAILPTVELLRKSGAKTILLSHLGREGETLAPVAKHCEKYFPLNFIPEEDFSIIKEKVDALSSGEVVLLENLRRNHGEEGNDSAFARNLASLGDYYVNEAFSNSHRNASSITLLPTLLPSCAGVRFEEEVVELSKVFSPKHPFLFVLGGAKFETKEPLIEKFLSIADKIFVGGAIANDFLKARGLAIGASLISEMLPQRHIFMNEKILIPSDVMVRTEDGGKANRYPSAVGTREIISDIGSESGTLLEKEISKAKMILWNGPLGLSEYGFDWGTKKVATLIAESGAISIVGGGDTLATINSLDLMEKFSFVSTGGGAMLEFLAKETLPGIDALSSAKRIV